MVAMINALSNAIWCVSIPFSIRLYFPLRKWQKVWLITNIQWWHCQDKPIKTDDKHSVSGTCFWYTQVKQINSHLLNWHHITEKNIKINSVSYSYKAKNVHKSEVLAWMDRITAVGSEMSMRVSLDVSKKPFLNRNNIKQSRGFVGQKMEGKWSGEIGKLNKGQTLTGHSVRYICHKVQERNPMLVSWDILKQY